MKKTDKKRERDLVAALTRVCDYAQATVPGFEWITHFVNYESFPDSLRVVSVFGTDRQLRAFCAAKNDEHLSGKIRGELKTLGITLNAKGRQLIFDSEEACEREHAGNWQRRYQNRPLH